MVASPASMIPAGAGGSAPAQGSKGQAPQILAPFTRAAHEHVEPFLDNTIQLDGNTHSFGPTSLPAYGYARSVIVLVTASGGADSGETVAVTADAPWNVISQIQLTDVNGAPIFGPFGGYNWMLANLFGGYVFNQAPVNSPLYTAPVVGASASGNFQFMLRIPLEITSRDGLGSLPNQNAASTYKMTYTQAASTTVYSTPPDTLPTIRVRAWLEAWTQPDPVDLMGRPQATVPPAMGTTQFWSEQVNPSVGSGFQTIQLPRVGNLLRNFIVVTRGSDDSARTDEFTSGTSLQIQMDGRILLNEIPEIRKNYQAERFNLGDSAQANLTGVYVYDFTHDLAGKGGEELRDLYIPTTQATRLEIVGTLTEASQVSILTNDVAPTAEIAVM